MTTGHVPFDTRVFQKECRTLAAAGYDVTLVAGHDANVEVEGVHLVAVRIPRSRWERLLVAPWRVLRAALRVGGDVFHFHDPDLIPAAFVLAVVLRKKVVYDSHEDVPRLLLDREWLPRRLRHPISRTIALLERWIVRSFALVISAEDTGAERFRPVRALVVRNYVRSDEFPTELPEYSTRPRRITYVGDLTRQRGIPELVAAVGLVPPDIGAELVLAGRMNTPGLEADLHRSPGWPDTRHVGWLERTEVTRLLAESRVGAVTWHPTRKHAEGAVPVKLFEYMAAGLPVVASDLPAIRSVVARDGVGILVDPSDVAAIAEAFEWLLTHEDDAAEMGHRGREAVVAHYQWDSEARTLLDAYSDLIGTGH